MCPSTTEEWRGSPKVVELVEEYLAKGSSPEELQFQHPYLTRGQVHGALAGR
jgi:hypothetical protein